MKVTRRQLCLLCGATLSPGLGGCIGIFDQGADQNSDGSQDESTDIDQDTTDTDEETGSEDDTETEDNGQSDSSNREPFDENTETDEFVLNIFQLPDDFEFHDEELLIVSELTEDDPKREELEENKIVRQHRREFVEDAKLDEASFVSSTVYICETNSDALELKQNKIKLFSEEREIREASKGEFRYPTTIATGGTNENKSFFMYIAHNQNMIFELISVGSLEQTVVARTYREFIDTD